MPGLTDDFSPASPQPWRWSIRTSWPESSACAAKTGFCDAAGIATDWQEGYPDAADFARTLVHCIDVPDRCVIEEVNIWGTKQIPEMVNPY